MVSIKKEPIGMTGGRGHVRERILRVLLNTPDGSLTKYRLAKLSGANISWVIETLRNLEKQNFVKATRVVDYAGVVIAWREWKTRAKSREYMVQEPLDLLKDAKLKYALTTYYAENLVQGYLFQSRVDLYINPEDLEDWHKTLAEKGLVGKGNVRILMADKHVFYNSIEKNGLVLVSIPQLIVDLLEEGAAAAEAAEMLIEKEAKKIVPKL